MRAADLPHVRQIERQSFSTPWSATVLRHELRHHAARYLVARAAVGAVALPAPPPRRGWLGRLLDQIAPREPAPSPHPVTGYAGVCREGPVGHITVIAVAPRWRRRGVGELLLQGLIDAAAELKVDSLILEVRVSNLAAQRLYERYGFVVTARHQRYYTDDREDALVMTTGPLRDAGYQAWLTERRHAVRRQFADAPAAEPLQTTTASDR
jgi:ribosomal-protein-alanine N-acetyltransferase